MAQEPKKRHSKARKKTRRAAIILKKVAVIKCSNCAKETIPHQVCKHCGFYGSKKITTKTDIKVVRA